MKTSIYLHRYIYDILRQFGEINDVVNRLLDAGSTGELDIYSKPPCPKPGRECSRYEIDITNTDYLKMKSIMGANSNFISLRRLLYWFVEHEIYVDLGWRTVKYVNKNTLAAINKLKKAKELIDNAMFVVDERSKQLQIEGISTKLGEVIDELQ